MNRYFKGWYFKAENEHQTVALIPAVHIDESGTRSASLQIITETGAWSVRCPSERFSCSGRGPRITIADNVFTERGARLYVNAEGISASGAIQFGVPSPLRYDIMGPFRFVPFMQCRHSVWSMTHTVRGCLTINGEEYRFEPGVGYTEGDRGRSFPRVYAWTQWNFFDRSPGSLMLSVAEIPFGALRFTGVIGVILWRGREYRLATYLGAKVVQTAGGRLIIRQGKLRFTAELVSGRNSPLKAPVCGDMKRTIRESIACTACYRLEEDGETLFEFRPDRAAFEYEYEN